MAESSQSKFLRSLFKILIACIMTGAVYKGYLNIKAQIISYE